MAVVSPKTRVLVLCDDYWHPAETARSGLAPIEESGRYAFDWIEDAHDWSEARMMEYPLVILTKSNHISSKDQTHWAVEEVESAFLRYLHAGNGILVIHSGIAGYADQAVLRGIMGGTFLSHPEQCSVTVSAIADHSITAGVTSFVTTDEHYMIELDDKKADIFLTTSSEHGDQPGGWTRLEGAGRVCVLTPGHNLHVWLDPTYQTLIQNALAWCGKLE